jgi:AraC family transcriptional regulator
MSPFHLARQFKRHTGSSLHAYRTQLRLRAAAHSVLDEPRRGLTDIATRLGFASHSHFTARFGRAFGTTPSGVRQSVGEPGLRKPAPTDAQDRTRGGHGSDRS